MLIEAVNKPVEFLMDCTTCCFRPHKNIYIGNTYSSGRTATMFTMGAIFMPLPMLLIVLHIASSVPNVFNTNTLKGEMRVMVIHLFTHVSS